MNELLDTAQTNRNNFTTMELGIHGMHCAACVRRVEKALAQVAGVTSAAVDLAAEKATVKTDAPVSPDALVAAVEQAGYEAVIKQI